MVDEEEMISKKEVLTEAGITYGQFYRWKREGLIPESWFERRSTFTGQEAFLPKAKILERIERIKALKDEHSLEEIAQLLYPEATGETISPENLGWISKEVLDYYTAARARSGPFAFAEIFQMAALEKLRELDLELEEIGLALSTLQQDHLNLGDEKLGWLLLVIRKPISLALLPTKKPRTISFCCIVPSDHFRLDPEAQAVAQVDLNKLLEETKIKIHPIE